jgi:hypothetical protein
MGTHCGYHPSPSGWCLQSQRYAQHCAVLSRAVPRRLVPSDGSLLVRSCVPSFGPDLLARMVCDAKPGGVAITQQQGVNLVHSVHSQVVGEALPAESCATCTGMAPSAELSRLAQAQLVRAPRALMPCRPGPARTGGPPRRNSDRSIECNVRGAEGLRGPCCPRGARSRRMAAGRGLLVTWPVPLRVSLFAADASYSLHGPVGRQAGVWSYQRRSPCRGRSAGGQPATTTGRDCGRSRGHSERHA